MDNKSYFDSVEKLLDELRELITRQKNDPAGIAKIDIDLTLEKIRQIYDIYLGTDKNNIGVEPANVAEKSDIIEEEPEPPSPIFEVQEQVVGDKLTETTESVEEVELKDEKPEPEIEQAPSSGDIIDLFSDSTVADKFSEKKAVVDKVSEEKQEESIADKMQKDKITDLKSAIGINEKFYFINELFDGNMKDYNETIEVLAGFKTLEEATNYVKEIKEKYKWDEGSDAVKQLTDFIERRYK
ncbi:MAG: hypothetical protein H8D45_16255 [Bacteroidetes bacterium]|nr:hypothetical protein [Bacteroidota bacterium]MBL7102854.1 hypothetical protein [Bacteroidales bacterium]